MRWLLLKGWVDLDHEVEPIEPRQYLAYLLAVIRTLTKPE
jgi:hypothetical protein